MSEPPERDAAIEPAIIDLAARRKGRIAIERGRSCGPTPAPEMLSTVEMARRRLREERRALMKHEGANGADRDLRRAWAAKAEWVAAMISMLLAEAVGSKLPVPLATIDRLDALVAELETEAARLDFDLGEAS